MTGGLTSLRSGPAGPSVGSVCDGRRPRPNRPVPKGTRSSSAAEEEEEMSEGSAAASRLLREEDAGEDYMMAAEEELTHFPLCPRRWAGPERPSWFQSSHVYGSRLGPKIEPFQNVNSLMIKEPKQPFNQAKAEQTGESKGCFLFFYSPKNPFILQKKSTFCLEPEKVLLEPGGARRILEEPGGSWRSLNEPAGARRSLEESGSPGA